MDLSSYALAKICAVPRTRIERIAREEISISADTALRLSKAFGTTPGFWLNLLTQFGIATAEKAIGKVLAKIVPVSRDAARATVCSPDETEISGTSAAFVPDIVFSSGYAFP